ncbi:hypothetical protein ACE2AJ_20610 [Aquihabitans daechungensis]|uniref:hypothetical protein n=1 Tax=Aquihabitans daechungensis TaxID=1052257 RepID=UPI003B9F3E4E
MGRDAMTSVRLRRRLVTAVVLLAVVSPVLRDRDSFPLSTYPMYASTRPEVVAFSTVLGYDDAGERVRLSLRTIARTDDALIGQSRIGHAIDSGTADALCTEVADRAPDAVTRIEVVTERHDVIDLAARDESLIDRAVHASCEPAR